jgi:riboflavin transporter FmnP
MQKETNIQHGLKWGVIIGIVYTLFLFLRYYLGAENPVLLGVFTFTGYLVVLILLLVSGFQRRKLSGGYITLKDAFQTMFVSVIVFELFFAIFNYIYLQYINPDFFVSMKNSLEEMMTRSNIDQDRIDEMLEKMDTDAAKELGFVSSLKSFAFSLVISGIFALIFALIIRRKKDVFLESDQPHITGNE